MFKYFLTTQKLHEKETNRGEVGSVLIFWECRLVTFLSNLKSITYVNNTRKFCM